MNILSLIQGLINKIVIKTDAIENIELLELAREVINKSLKLNLKVSFTPIDNIHHVDSIVVYFITKEENLDKVPENSIVFTINKKLIEKFGSRFFIKN